MGERRYEELEALARRARWLVVKSVAESKAGHIGGPLSMIDLLVALYFRQIRIRPDQPDWEDRDRFILSKGHAAIGLYAVMALRGYLPVEELATFDKGGSRLQGHPDITKLSGLDASTGSLGQGLSFGVGVAMGARMALKEFHTWVMLGDGEVQEGMVWEAAQVASRYKVSNLTAIVDCNGLQQYGLPSNDESAKSDRGDRRDPWSGLDLGLIFGGFGWRVVKVDGHDFGEILAAYDQAMTPDPLGRPTVILARTVKGRGLSLAEGVHSWHAHVPTKEQYELARAEMESATESAPDGPDQGAVVR